MLKVLELSELFEPNRNESKSIESNQNQSNRIEINRIESNSEYALNSRVSLYIQGVISTLKKNNYLLNF